MARIAVEGISMVFESQGTAREVLRDVSFEVATESSSRSGPADAERRQC
jgi:hypothetical protein